jgi:hypothetical protein
VFCLHDARRSGIECLNIRNRHAAPRDEIDKPVPLLTSSNMRS